MSNASRPRACCLSKMMLGIAVQPAAASGLVHFCSILRSAAFAAGGAGTGVVEVGIR